MNGKIFVIGIGPGSLEKMTVEAINAIKESDIVIGYTLYIELLKENFPDKKYDSTPMRKEIDRCELCFKNSLEGKTVSLVCSGDAGVYGMASPMYELQKQNSEYRKIKLEIIPGVTAANSGASVLGAPLNHDFCVISLSDLMTPWNLIEKRIRCAIEGDFAIAIYNPSSHKRKDYLKKALMVMNEAGASLERKCGYVQNIGRKGIVSEVCTLGELMEKEVDMFTTVFIGNSQSEILEDADGKLKLFTKRGYSI